jgi:hypothetical protein
VLSNIQPESLDALFNSMSEAGVRIVLIGDMYVSQSLSGNPDRLISYPMTGSRNWAHPYRALGKKYGYETFFFPDFTYTSFCEARGTFVLTKSVDTEGIHSAVTYAMNHYLERQNDCWDAYAKNAVR